MTYAIITSKECIAGQNIHMRLLELFPFKETGELFDGAPVYAADNCRLYTAKERHIFCEHIDERIPEDKIIFPSTHRSEQGVKSLCVHVTGNWGPADLGGEPGFLCTSMPREMRTALLKLHELAGADNYAAGSKYDITIEATHHGPAVDKPVMFIEIGCREDDWKDEEAGTIIAKTIMHVVKRFKIQHRSSDDTGGTECPASPDGATPRDGPDAVGLGPAENGAESCKAVVILGGGHYNQIGNKILAKTDYAVGHICPKHSLPLLTGPMLEQAIAKTPGFEQVILDWKGLGTEKDRVMKLLEERKIPFGRYKDFVKE